MLLLLALACHAPETKDSPQESTPPDSDSASTSYPQYPWDIPGFWENPGPMSPRIGSQEVAMGQWAVRMATSADGQTWTADPHIIAYGFSSLDLLNTGDGLIIAGVVQFIDGNTVMLEMPSILALTTKDLITWNSARFKLGNATRLWAVDASLRIAPNGQFEAHWYGTDIEGDPAGLPGEHEVYRGIWDPVQAQIMEDQLVFSREWLADPVMCSVDGQEDWLLYSLDGREVAVATPQNGALTDAWQYEFVNVPWCQQGDGQLTVYAQNTGGGGPPWKMAIQADGTMSKEMVYPVDIFGDDNCTSPAVTYFQDQYVLLCAVYTLH